jgi:hypothetical protein
MRFYSVVAGHLKSIRGGHLTFRKALLLFLFHWTWSLHMVRPLDGWITRIWCCPWQIDYTKSGTNTFHIWLKLKENHLKHYMDNFEALTISSSIKLTIEHAIPTLFLVSKPCELLHARHWKVTNSHGIG